MQLLKGLFMEARVLTIMVWSWSAVLLASALVINDFRLINYVYLFIGLILLAFFQGYPVHITNELTDWSSGTDLTGKGGSKVIREGLITIQAMRYLKVIVIVGFISIGIILSVLININLLIFGIIGFSTGYFYSSKPFIFAYRPFLGEWLSGFLGVFIGMLGMYYFLTNTINLSIISLAIYYGLHCIIIMLVAHSFDYKADKEAKPQKTTSIVYLGLQKGQYYLRLLTILEFLGLFTFIITSAIQYEQLIAYYLLFTSTLINFYLFWNADLDLPKLSMDKLKIVTYTTIVFNSLFFIVFDPLAVWVIIIPMLVFISHKKFGKIKKVKKE